MRKNLMDSFETHLEVNFREYCTKHCISNNEKMLLSYLIDQGIVSESNIRRYAIIKEFQRIFPHVEGQKSKAVSAIADRYAVSERTIWNIIKDLETNTKLPSRTQEKKRTPLPQG